MIFQDNILKAYLSNVYFVARTPCGGKTTASRALGRKHGIRVYDIDEQFERHTRQQLDFVLLDLIRLSQTEPIICYCHLSVGEVVTAVGCRFGLE